MDPSRPSTKRFYAYPPSVEAPDTPFTKTEEANPVFSGRPLAAGAWVISNIPFLHSVLWKNAGFAGLRDIPHLGQYTDRMDPTVVPLGIEGSTYELPKLESTTALPDNLPGRYRTVAEYHSLYLSGELTPLAVAESLLPLIRRDIDSPSTHSIAFTNSIPATIIAAAEASTLRYQTGAPLSILDGVPTAIKDDCRVAGYRTTEGRAKNDAFFQPEEKSAWAVQQWEDAGVLILGKLNMHEIGADTTNNNPNWGCPRNPHNTSYYPGGSSGGPAYAVSAGLIPFALGTDGGGSVRIPSSFCGIYGLKPSHHRLEVSESSVTVSGPLAATMSDLEIAYRIAASPNPSDPICSLFASPTLTPAATTRPKLIGIYDEWFDRASPAVSQICRAALAHYEKTLGYQIIPIKIPYCPESQKAHAFTILAEMAANAKLNAPNPANYTAGLNPANKILVGVGAATPSGDYLLAQRLRNMLMQHLAFLFQTHPGLVIVTPTTPLPGWAIANDPADLSYGVTDGNKSIRNMEYVWLANFTGCPAISCPVGYAAPEKGEGAVPVGLMGMGEWGSEMELMEWGREAEGYLNGVLEGGRKRPGVWVDVVQLARKKGKGGSETEGKTVDE